MGWLTPMMQIMNRLVSLTGIARARGFDPGESEAGQSMVEYAFIISLVAIILIVVVIILGNQTFNMWRDIQTTFPHS